VFASSAHAGPSTGTQAGDDPAGGIGLRLVDAPAAARDDPRARLYIVDHLAPGAVIERRIEVSNTTGSAESIVLYAAAASIDDGLFVGAQGETANELSTWTALAPDRSDIPAGGTLMATVTITVPSDAAPGEQYGVVWAEARSDDESAGGVVQVSRVGIRLYVSVGPGGAPAADFTIESLTAGRSPNGQPTLSASVRNTGGRALDLTGTLQLSSGPGGLSAGPFPADLGRTLAIGDTQPITVSLDESLPAGPWDAEILLASGIIERRAEATITFPDSGLAAAVAPTASGSTPWWLLAAVAGLGLVLAIVASGLIRRRRRGMEVRDRVATHAPARALPIGPASGGPHRKPAVHRARP
jgi:hypothetical protein